MENGCSPLPFIVAASVSLVNYKQATSRKEGFFPNSPYQPEVLPVDLVQCPDRVLVEAAAPELVVGVQLVQDGGGGVGEAAAHNNSAWDVSNWSNCISYQTLDVVVPCLRLLSCLSCVAAAAAAAALLMLLLAPPGIPASPLLLLW